MNEEASKRVLRAILRDGADYHFVGTQEEERVEDLENMRDAPEFTADDRVNLDAVVSDYKAGSLLCPAEGKAIIYFGGVRKTSEPVNINDYPIIEMVDQWIAAGERGRAWTEEV